MKLLVLVCFVLYCTISVDSEVTTEPPYRQDLLDKGNELQGEAMIKIQQLLAQGKTAEAEELGHLRDALNNSMRAYVKTYHSPPDRDHWEKQMIQDINTLEQALHK
ncbi:unnamed protein product [Oppiella nova]|uniref:Uncharacterized protein n=1 Tax=Oppiella nova TaxID=334625 RepID=A0A7R9QLY8_9ACAR|nr:unnamed protein product [Oppiella nova]CAG2168510.1 unnamed protein product [Oppiella nova]